MKGVRRFVSVILAVCLMLPLSAEAIQTKEGVQITILHTNDTHTRLKAGDDFGKSMGWAQLVSAIRKEREMNPDALVLDAGDTFHGTPAVTVSRGENMIPLLNLAGYDAMCPGNHDFDYGSDRLVELADQLDFPVLCANVADKHTGNLLFSPYKEFNLSGVRIAVFGLATPDTAVSASPTGLQKVDFLDPVKQTQWVVDRLRKDHDLVIGLMHMGVNHPSVYTSTLIAKKVKGIDVIIDGHSHTVLPVGIKEGNTLICQTGSYDWNLGEVTVTVKDHDVVKKSARLLDRNQVAELAPVPDAVVLEEIRRMDERNRAAFERVVGYSKRGLEYNREKLRTQETELGDYVADALKGVSGADIGFVNSGTIRAALPTGNVTKKDVIDISPFGNTVKKVEVTGRQVMEMLEQGVSLYPGDAGRFLQVSGASFVLDASQPVGSRISHVEVNGRPLSLDGKYSVAVTDFMAAGGDGYTMLKDAPILGEYGLLDEVLAAWVQQGKEVRDIGTRIRILEASGKKAA